MPRTRFLKSAPITEALIDLRVKTREDFKANELEVLKGILASELPKVEEQRGGQVTFKLFPSEKQPPKIEDFGLQGYFLKSADESIIAQFRIDGFTFNKLKPYTRWEEILPKAKQLWEKYSEIARPDAVIRVALRYINRIPLPDYVASFDTYLRAGPSVPPELPQEVGSYFSRITLVDDTRKVLAHVAQKLELPTETSKVSFLIDIDTFKEVDFDPKDPAIWDVFAKLREFKNQIFFNYLTDKSLEQFE